MAEVEILLLEKFLHAFQLLDHIDREGWIKLSICFYFGKERNEVNLGYVVDEIAIGASAGRGACSHNNKKHLTFEKVEYSEDAMVLNLVVRRGVGHFIVHVWTCLFLIDDAILFLDVESFRIEWPWLQCLVVEVQSRANDFEVVWEIQ